MNTDEQGKEFQDYLMEIIHIPFYSSKEYQMNKGETPSILGIETKFNKKAHEIGCWIEILEKRDKNNPHWIVTNWIINDKVFLILAGNYKIQWIFSKWVLLKLSLERKWKEIKVGTSIGFFLNKYECDQICIWNHTESTIQTKQNIIKKVILKIEKEYPSAKILNRKRFFKNIY